jgi:hypothetical protein
MTSPAQQLARHLCLLLLPLLYLLPLLQAATRLCLVQLARVAAHLHLLLLPLLWAACPQVAVYLLGWWQKQQEAQEAATPRGLQPAATHPPCVAAAAAALAAAVQETAAAAGHSPTHPEATGAVCPPRVAQVKQWGCTAHLQLLLLLQLPGVPP